MEDNDLLSNSAPCMVSNAADIYQNCDTLYPDYDKSLKNYWILTENYFVSLVGNVNHSLGIGIAKVRVMRGSIVNLQNKT